MNYFSFLNKFKKTITILIFASWVFSGWPRVGNFPQQIPKAYAASVSAFAGTTSQIDDTSYASNDCTDSNGEWNSAGVGTPGNASASDNSYIAVTTITFDVGDGTDELQFSNFGFSIPDGSTIDGVVVEVERHTDATENVVDAHVMLTTAVGVQEGDDKSTGAAWATTDPDAYAVSFGGVSDIWGATGGLTEAEVEGSGFGVVLCGRAPTTSNNNPKIDALRMTVYYTPPAPAASRVIKLQNAIFKFIGGLMILR